MDEYILLLDFWWKGESTKHRQSETGEQRWNSVPHDHLSQFRSCQRRQEVMSFHNATDQTRFLIVFRDSSERNSQERWDRIWMKPRRARFTLSSRNNRDRHPDCFRFTQVVFVRNIKFVGSQERSKFRKNPRLIEKLIEFRTKMNSSLS
jgi:hypothetical protein